MLKAQTTVIDSLDQALQQLAADGYLSANLFLAEGDKVLLRKSYGYSDFANKVPLQEDAVLELASVSKQFTAAAVAMLAKDGKLDLDAPVVNHLPELAAYPKVTVRQLVHHALHGMPLEVESLLPPKTAPVDIALAKKLTGTYAVSPDFKLCFFVENNKFMAQATGQQAFELSGTDKKDRYSIPEVEAEIQFQRDDNGKATSLTLFQSGQEIPAKREE